MIIGQERKVFGLDPHVMWDVSTEDQYTVIIGDTVALCSTLVSLSCLYYVVYSATTGYHSGQEGIPIFVI